MKKYLITYNLKTPNWNYTGFFNALQNIGPWWHYIDSTWIVKSNLTAQQIYSRIAPGFLSTSDFILIIEIKSESKFGWLPQEAWNWIDSNN
jgi:hypothetical protein